MYFHVFFACFPLFGASVFRTHHTFVFQSKTNSAFCRVWDKKPVFPLRTFLLCILHSFVENFLTNIKKMHLQAFRIELFEVLRLHALMCHEVGGGGIESRTVLRQQFFRLGVGVIQHSLDLSVDL